MRFTGDLHGIVKSEPSELCSQGPFTQCLLINKMAAAVENKSLKNVFQQALDNYNEIDAGKLSGNEQQTLIKKTIELLEESTRLVNIGEVFSSNELLEEVSTDSIQFLAIPCMLGNLAGRLQSGDRVANLEVSEIYYKDFLNRGREYGLVPESLKTDVERVLTAQQDLTRIVMDRKEKVRKYEEQKKLIADLVELRVNLERADDEVRRRYFTLFVKSFVSQAEEELRSIAMEKPLAAMRKSHVEDNVKLPKRELPPPLKPIIITRNELQKKVYGLGYPSLPTMTVDEFYEERVREGIFPAGGSNYAKSLQDSTDPELQEKSEREEEERKEKLEEEDDPEELQRRRNMDEFKDEHRRGWGNRHNRS